MVNDMKVDGSTSHYHHYAFPMQTVLVTCKDARGKVNIITLACHTPISLRPPLYGISVAPKRYSCNLIREDKDRKPRPLRYRQKRLWFKGKYQY